MGRPVTMLDAAGMMHKRKRAPPRKPGEVEAGDGPRLPLRLAVSRGQLALELEEGVELGPVEVSELAVSLTGLTYPLDLSGGVAKFRHRRGALERLVLSARRERLVELLSPRLRGVLGSEAPRLSLAPASSGGIQVGLWTCDRVLAFDLLWAPRETDIRWLICRARAIGSGLPALVHAFQVVDCVFGHFASRRGALLTIGDGAAAVAKRVLPGAGARVPSCEDMRWGSLEVLPDGYRATCDRAHSRPLLGDDSVRELELARMAVVGDDLLAAGELDAARREYLRVLEQAPRHPELARRIADLDRAVGERAEAALGMLGESMPIAEAGELGAELVAATGDAERARKLWAAAAEREPFGPLAAAMLLNAGTSADSLREKLRLFDQGVARAPAHPGIRWARLHARLSVADVDGAVADAEHLEAACRGASERHEVWRRAADAFCKRGHAQRAMVMYEKSLRYIPRSSPALAGLARSLLEMGRPGRALDLLSHAVDLAQAHGDLASSLLLELARALAQHAGDIPAAIARLRSIPDGTPDTLEARALEGSLRARLGDCAGASLAYAAMRQWAELVPEERRRDAAAWLLEAGRFEQQRQDDPLSAQQHFGAALRMLPRSRLVAEAFRQACAAASEKERAHRDAAPVEPLSPTVSIAEEDSSDSVDEPSGLLDFSEQGLMEEEHSYDGKEEDEQLAQALTDSVRANPADLATVLRLSAVLERLHRDLELFALLSASREDAAEPQREQLAPPLRRVLARLVEAAETSDRTEEAELYRMSLEVLSRENPQVGEDS